MSGAVITIDGVSDLDTNDSFDPHCEGTVAVATVVPFLIIGGFISAWLYSKIKPESKGVLGGAILTSSVCFLSVMLGMGTSITALCRVKENK